MNGTERFELNGKPLDFTMPDFWQYQYSKLRCIGCMRCIAVCPADARKLPVVLKALGGVALRVLCSTRKENELLI